MAASAPMAMIQIGRFDGDSLKIYPAMKDGKLVGAAVESNTQKGFSGEIKVIVGFDTEGKLLNYSALQHSETPGLGAKMQEWFRADKNHQSVLGRKLADGGLNASRTPVRMAEPSQMVGSFFIRNF